MNTTLEVQKLLTDDGVTVQVAWIPPRAPDLPVLLWTHGVGSSFTLSGLWTVCQHLASQGWGVAFINNRGHDWVALNPGDRRWIGAAFERFEDCVLDFQAALRWLRERGCRRIVIGGHSLGGLKAAYTQAFHPVDEVIALAMLSSPRLPDEQVWDWPAHERLLAYCGDRIAEGRGEELMHIDMPTSTPAAKGVMCHRTYVNKYGPDAATTALRFADRIRVPTLLLAGELERPQLSFSADMERALVHAPAVRRIAVEGCDHIYTGSHARVAGDVQGWLSGLV